MIPRKAGNAMKAMISGFALPAVGQKRKRLSRHMAIVAASGVLRAP